jgi:hypothetical protein
MTRFENRKWADKWYNLVMPIWATSLIWATLVLGFVGALLK